MTHPVTVLTAVLSRDDITQAKASPFPLEAKMKALYDRLFFANTPSRVSCSDLQRPPVETMHTVTEAHS